MRDIGLSILLVVALAGVKAEEADQNDPKVREAIIGRADELFSKGEYREAAKYYRFGITYWDAPEQSDDLERACSSLFGLLYKIDRHINRKELLSGCPEELMRLWYSTDDREAHPVLKVPHEYPEQALEDGLEGWVIVEFDVTEKGRVKNVKVKESSNPIFNEQALKAPGSYLYLPAIKNGVAVEQEGVENKLTFKLSR